MLDTLIQEEKLNGCHGCVIQDPSQREHSCLMMDSEEACLFYHDEAREKSDVNDFLKTANSVCSLLGFKLGSSWETYLRGLHKLPWTNLYLTSLELETGGERTQTTFKLSLFTNMLKIVYTWMGSDTWKFQTLRVLWETSRLPMYGFNSTDRDARGLMLSLRDGDREAMAISLSLIGSR